MKFPESMFMKITVHNGHMVLRNVTDIGQQVTGRYYQLKGIVTENQNQVKKIAVL
jgi:hypothetical protein